MMEEVANKFLAAVKHAGKIYRLLLERKGAGRFVPEVSMDETDYAADAGGVADHPGDDRG